MSDKANILAFWASDRLLIDRHSETPIYRQLMDQLKQEISSGFFSVSDRFPTEQEIADRLGLSMHTVRQALLGLTQEGYLVRHRGRGSFVCNPKDQPLDGMLVSRKTQRVGLVMPWGEHTFFARVLNDVENAMHGQGYRTMLVNNHDEADIELERMRELVHNGVDGVIWMCPSRGVHPQVVEMIRQMLPNVVAVDRLDPKLKEDVSLVNANNTGGMAALVEKLYKAGRKRIALVRSAADISSINDRVAGYRQGFQNMGVQVPRDWIFPVALTSQSPSAAHAGGYEAARRLLASGQKFDAVCCCTDFLALGVIQALEDHGLAVPGDMAVAGFDDSIEAISIKPGLTSVHMNLGTIASEAAALLLKQMALHDMGQVVSRVHINVPVRVVMRQSAVW